MLHCRKGWRRGSPSWEALHAAACPSVQKDRRAHLLEERWSLDDQVSSLHAAVIDARGTARSMSISLRVETAWNGMVRDQKTYH